MRSTLRASTAVIASLAIMSSHVPLTAVAQEFHASQCLEGETEDDCLARLLEEGAAAEDAPTEEQPADEQPADEQPEAEPEEPVTEEAPVEEAPVEEETVEEAPVEEAPVEEAPVDEAPVEEAPVEDAPVEEAPVEEAPVEEAPVDEEPVEEAPVEEAPVEEAPVEEAPVEEAPVEEAPVEEAPVEEAPVEEAPVEEAPVEEAPVEDSEASEPAAAPTTDEDALADALADAEAEADGAGQTDADAEMAENPDALMVQPDDLTAEEAEALEAARAAAAAAEEAAATPVDPVAEAEAEIAEAEAEAAEAQQSLAIQDDAAPVASATEETITEDNTRRSDQDFEQLMTATTEQESRENGRDRDRDRDDDRDGLTGTQGLILGGIAGLAIGSIITGNREVVNRADDRLVVLRPDGDYQVIRDDDTLLRRPGNTVATDTFADGSSRTVVTQPDGTEVITVRDRDLRILRRTVVAPDGTRTILIDDIAVQTPVTVSELPRQRAVTPSQGTVQSTDADALARALASQTAAERGYSLAQIRSIRAVRDLAPSINLENVTFDTGSAAISPEQARQLLALGRFMSEAIADNPREVFLIEGHTDATGSASFNLGLSDRRAETVALALTEYFGVPPQNMVIQGYGEEFLLIPTLDNERLNRRVAVRRITDLLRVAAAD